LLILVCVSATQVAWGAIFLEPVWMQPGEPAGVAVALPVKQGIPPAHLDPDRLEYPPSRATATISGCFFL